MPLGLGEKQQVGDQVHDLAGGLAADPASVSPLGMDVGVQSGLSEFNSSDLRSHGRSPGRPAVPSKLLAAINY